MKAQSRAKGIGISYAVTAFRALSQFILTKLYLDKLGYDGYGFYQYVYSIASYAIILDFGISSVVNKFVIERREQNDEKGVENVLFWCLVMTLMAIGIIALAGVGIVGMAGTIFGDMSAEQMVLARQLLITIVLYIITLLFQHYFEGVLLAGEQYVTLRTINLFQIVAKVIVVVLLLYSNIGAMSIAISDLSSALLCLAFSVGYGLIAMKVRVRYHYVDKPMLGAAAKLAGSLCLQSVVLYINSSIDKYLIGRLLDNTAVTIYTVALTFSHFFDEIPSVIQRMYLPQAVKLVTNGADGEQLTDFVIKPGRIQFILCGGLLAGFTLFGQQLILLWAGAEAALSWWIALLLMAASLIPLIQNVCLAILTAMNKRLFRSYMLIIAAVLHFFLTWILVKHFGLLGAPIGSFIALVLCNNIIMNWYYKVKIGINIRRLFSSIFKGILPSVLLTTIICLPLRLVNQVSILWLGCECALFMVIYAACLWIFGLCKDEKIMISKRLSRCR